MSDEHLSRKRLLQTGGGLVASTIVLGKVASAAAASTTAADDGSTVAVLTEVSGRNGSARSADGTVFSGKIQNLRPLQVGDRVVVEPGGDGHTISPLFVEIVGTVQSVNGSEVLIDGASYAIDSQSLLRRRKDGRWIDSGPVAKSLEGGEIEGLGIINLNSGQTVLALAWAR